MLVDNNAVSKCHTANYIVFSYMYTGFIITCHFKQQLIFNETDFTSSWLHRATMISNTFIVQLMHTTLKNVELLKYF